MALLVPKWRGLAVAAVGHAALFVLLVGRISCAAPNPHKLVSADGRDDRRRCRAGKHGAADQQRARGGEEIAGRGPGRARQRAARTRAEPEPVAKPQPTPRQAACPRPMRSRHRRPSRRLPRRPPIRATKPRNAVRPTGNLEGLDLGRSNNRTNSTSTNPPAAMMSTQAAADIGSAIKQQVQPCANRQVNPGPGADQIRVVRQSADQSRRVTRRSAADRRSCRR